MATFIGTKKEFTKYVGHSFKNSIPQKTRKIRNDLLESKCEYCGKEESLHSAHIFGLDREKIIEYILDDYFKSKNNVHEVDIEKFDLLFNRDHYPLIGHFYFLCKECHTKYDNKEIKEVEIKNKRIKNNVIKVTEEDVIETYKKDFENVQEYIKRVLIVLYNLTLLTDNHLLLLQDKEYCKKTFGIKYSWLEKNKEKIKIKGHYRYYASRKIFDDFYITNDWWTTENGVHIEKIHSWINELYNEYKARQKKKV